MRSYRRAAIQTATPAAISVNAINAATKLSSNSAQNGPSVRHKNLMSSIIGTAFIASLSACVTPGVQTRTVEVKIPVAVQPIKPAQVPAVPSPLAARPQSLSAAADLLLADHCKWVAYGLLADPLLRVSAGEPPQPLPAYPECERR